MAYHSRVWLSCLSVQPLNHKPRPPLPFRFRLLHLRLQALPQPFGRRVVAQSGNERRHDGRLSASDTLCCCTGTQWRQTTQREQGSDGSVRPSSDASQRSTPTPPSVRAHGHATTARKQQRVLTPLLSVRRGRGVGTPQSTQPSSRSPDPSAIHHRRPSAVRRSADHCSDAQLSTTPPPSSLHSSSSPSPSAVVHPPHRPHRHALSSCPSLHHSAAALAHLLPSPSASAWPWVSSLAPQLRQP